MFAAVNMIPTTDDKRQSPPEGEAVKGVQRGRAQVTHIAAKLLTRYSPDLSGFSSQYEHGA